MRPGPACHTLMAQGRERQDQMVQQVTSPWRTEVGREIGHVPGFGLGLDADARCL